MAYLERLITNNKLQHLAEKIFEDVDTKGVYSLRRASKKFFDSQLLFELHLKNSINKRLCVVNDKIDYTWGDASEPSKNWIKPMNLLLTRANFKEKQIMMKFINNFKNMKMFPNLESARLLHQVCKTNEYEMVKLMIELLPSDYMNFNSKFHFERTSPLQCAILEGNYETLEVIFNHVDPSLININARDDNGQTPLILACRSGKENITALFLENISKFNIDLLPQDNTGNNALHLLCASGLEESAILLADKMISADADTIVNQPNKQGQTPLHIACSNGHSKIVESYLQMNDFNLNARDEAENTLLHYAVIANKSDIIQLILEHSKIRNIDLDAKNKRNQNLLHCAFTAGRYSVHSLLQMTKNLPESQMDPNSKDNDGQTPIHYLCANGDIRLFDYYIQFVSSQKSFNIDFSAQDNAGNTPLHIACESNYLIAKHLIENASKFSVGLEIQNYQKQIPLHLACYNTNKLVELILKTVSPEIQLGLQINATDNFGRTPLHHAIMSTFESVTNRAKLLLDQLVKHKGDVNIKDTNGQTALHYACHYGNQELLKTIFQYGDLLNIDFNPEDKDGKTPLDIAGDKSPECGSFFIECAINHKCHFNFKDKEGWTPLHYACLKSDYKLVKLIIENSGSDISVLGLNVQDGNWKTPLHYVCHNITNKISTNAILNVFMKTELAPNINFKIQDKSGNTPLHLQTVTSFQAELLPIILKHGNPDNIDLNIVNNRGETPFSEFCLKGDIASTRAMLEYAMKHHITLTFPEYQSMSLSYAYMELKEKEGRLQRSEILGLLFEYSEYMHDKSKVVKQSYKAPKTEDDSDMLHEASELGNDSEDSEDNLYEEEGDD